MRKKQETIKRMFAFTPALNDKLLEIQDHMGFKTLVATLEYCIFLTHKKEIENYVQITKKRTPQNGLTQEERSASAAEKYTQSKDARDKLLIEKGYGICELLGGEVEEEGVNSYCRWNVYEKENPHLVSIGEFKKPLVDMHENMVETQFRGADKKEIFKILKQQD